ncbi:MAG: hypothetical protein ABW203_00540 [Novosphingobium sp.]
MRRDSFYRHIRPPDPRQLCDELAEALAGLRQVENVGIAAMGYANPKAPEFVCVLDRVPSAAAVAAARAVCGSHPEVVFVADGIGCRRHWSELHWEDRPPRPEPDGEGLLRRAMRAVTGAARPRRE